MVAVGAKQLQHRRLLLNILRVTCMDFLLPYGIEERRACLPTFTCFPVRIFPWLGCQ